jgi:hypothetical protein
MELKKCGTCGKSLGGFYLYRCSYCGGVFCSDHRLCEKHNCQGTYDITMSVYTDPEKREAYKITPKAVVFGTERDVIETDEYRKDLFAFPKWMRSLPAWVTTESLYSLERCPKCGSKQNKTARPVGYRCDNCDTEIVACRERKMWWNHAWDNPKAAPEVIFGEPKDYPTDKKSILTYIMEKLKALI